MSAKAVGWALDQPLDPVPKLALVTLGDCMNAETGKCCPSQAFIAGVVRRSVKTIATHLDQLERSGYITRYRRTHPEDGHRLADGYELHVGRDDQREETSPRPYLLEVDRSTLPEAQASEPNHKSEPNPMGVAVGSASLNGDTALGSTSEVDSSAMRARSVSFRGRRVPAAVLTVAEDAVATWSERTGQALRCYDGQDRPTESLRRVVGAMLAYPEVAELYGAMIERALAERWWGDDPRPAVGVVFGPKVVERMVEAAKSPEPLRARRNGNGRGPSARDFHELAEQLRAEGR